MDQVAMALQPDWTHGHSRPSAYFGRVMVRTNWLTFTQEPTLGEEACLRIGVSALVVSTLPGASFMSCVSAAAPVGLMHSSMFSVVPVTPTDRTVPRILIRHDLAPI